MVNQDFSAHHNAFPWYLEGCEGFRHAPRQLQLSTSVFFGKEGEPSCAGFARIQPFETQVTDIRPLSPGLCQEKSTASEYILEGGGGHVFDMVPPA